MLVSIVSDDLTKYRQLENIIRPSHVVVPTDAAMLHGHDVPRDAILVDYDLRDVNSITQLQRILETLDRRCRRIFVLNEKTHTLIAQASALGASDVIARPVRRAELLAKLSGSPADAAPEEAWLYDRDLNESARAFRSLFAAVATGGPIDIQAARCATAVIIKRVSDRGLSSWLETVRMHHRGTFQHCLIVSGIAVSFALMLDFPIKDVQRLGLAATLHDIGKAKVPVSLLDKPGRLDPDEERIVRQHPRDGYEALLVAPDIEPAVLDAVLHHHEFLDGSGYPDGIGGSSLGDLVRLLTISDIFGALVEDRSYRLGMRTDQAYAVLCSMEGKLEGALVNAFAKVTRALT
jgi:HD-GYP domain-containing protein (c-di-GMP phosphodiesterase class II)